MSTDRTQPVAPSKSLFDLSLQVGSPLSVPAILFDENGHILDQTDSFKNLLQTATTLSGKPNWLSLGHNFIGAISSRQGSLQLEEVVSIAGQKHTYRVTLKLIQYDPSHKPDAKGLIVTFVDITEMTRYRDLYQGMRQQFQDITRLVSDWVWEVDSELTFSMVSGRITAVLGFLEHHILKAAIDDIMQSVEGQNVGLRHIMRKRHPFREHEVMILNSQQHACFFLVSGLPIYDHKNGNFRGYRGVARDISAQRKAQLQVVQYQQHLSNAVQSISEGFELYTSEGVLLMCNNKVSEFWPEISEYFVVGTSRKQVYEAIKRKGLVSPDQLQAWYTHLADEKKNQQPFELKMMSGRWFTLYERHVHDGGRVVISSDITEAKLREAALLKAKETAEIANRSKTDFLANVSHELRTPMNAIIGFSQLMQEEMLGPIAVPQYKEYLGNILESAHHLLSLINDLLDVSRAELGQHTLIEEEIDLSQAVLRAFSMVRERAWEQNLEISLDMPTTPLYILGDGRKIKQIILNLVSNAIKFTPEKGKITVGVKDLLTNGLEIFVQDTGIGMKEAQVPIALAPFGQIDSALNRKFEGTGLGLPLSNALAKLHDSHLRIKSTPGKGTYVSFIISQDRCLRS